MKQLLKKKKKVELSEEEVKKQKREKTANQWIPIADIDGSIVYRKDGLLFGALRIQPENIDLLSDREKKRRVESLAEEINGITKDWQIFCIGRPVDLNNYLEWLQDKAKREQDFIRKQVLKGYIQQASKMASSGETTERRFYIVINQKQDHRAKEDLLRRLEDLKIKLQKAELTAHICLDDELLDLLSLFAHPIQASYEKTELQHSLPTLLEY